MGNSNKREIMKNYMFEPFEHEISYWNKLPIRTGKLNAKKVFFRLCLVKFTTQETNIV